MNEKKLYKHCFSSTGIYLGCKEVNPLMDRIKAIATISVSILATMTLFLYLCKSRGLGMHSYNNSATAELHSYR